MRYHFCRAIFACLLISFTSHVAAAAELPPAAELRGKLEAVRGRLPDFKQRIGALRAAGQDVSYPLVTFTVLENFTPYALEDLARAVPSGWGVMGVNGFSVS